MQCLRHKDPFKEELTEQVTGLRYLEITLEETEKKQEVKLNSVIYKAGKLLHTVQ